MTYEIITLSLYPGNLSRPSDEHEQGRDDGVHRVQDHEPDLL